ncbi:ChaN family lipoprotein [Pedobacter sp. SYP-B3415]|uniref:ChaN family lipoprotein n=1 Tax=Pedobacter sp. SYP-B3415 TaxID=2496641 RepID=UPI00101E1257|nr:ChaN family lipoprotein [Pedobacter sp. SYP-B3415]
MRFILFTFLFACTISTYAQPDVSTYKIYDTRSKSVVSLEDVVKSARSADVLFFGEEHNDSVGHALEHNLLILMHREWPQKIALSMEMFHTDIQPVMDEYLIGLISEKNFSKDARIWSNYKDYRPMIEFAKANKVPVIAANTPTRYTNAVTMNGLNILKAFPQASRSFLPPLPVDTVTGAYLQKFNAQLGGHSMGSMKIYQTQNLWDSSMGWSVASFLKKNKGYKILHLNGRFHSDEKLGAYARLAAYAPQLKLLSISCFAADDFRQPDWAAYTGLADFVILTNPSVKKTF